MFQNWSGVNAPFAAVFVFPSVADHDRARTKRAGIFCPVHWPAVSGLNERVCRLAATVLTIPADQRYNITDMDRIIRA
jgi:hypothetical protein